MSFNADLLGAAICGGEGEGQPKLTQMRGQDDDRVRAWQLVADGDSRWGVVQRITAPVDEHSLEEAFIVVVDGKAFKIARCERNLVGLAHNRWNGDAVA